MDFAKVLVILSGAKDPASHTKALLALGAVELFARSLVSLGMTAWKVPDYFKTRYEMPALFLRLGGFA